MFQVFRATLVPVRDMVVVVAEGVVVGAGAGNMMVVPSGMDLVATEVDMYSILTDRR
jgi:hypothetical protein